ncbi:MAG TPA: hypothetical protein VET26_08605, partial [Candidatus Sulfotelmatobacter sp.]|nr:hypothetical protein [Candidatus Sulfotelmatobacter sp.]
MSDLDELFRYNAWANAIVLAKARESTDPGVHDTLAHLVSVEAVYTLMIRGGSPAPSAGRAAYMARPNGEFVDEAAD